MKRHLAFASIATLAILLASCGTMGDILGGPQSSSYPSSGSSTDLYGTVNSVDSNRQQINVNVNDYNGQRNMYVPYDSRTQVAYQGQYGSPTQLERGDQITIRMRSNGVADLITVTQSVSANSSGYPNNTYPYPNNPAPYPSSQSAGRISGTVSYVDTQARLIQLSNSYMNGLRTNDNTYTIYYDSRTRVMFQGRNYTPSDLERGDQVDVTTYNTGGQTLADTITVTRNVRQ